jgi:nucleotide-binding universal stress UspA family protein
MAYQHILVPVDGSEISFSAVKHAAQIAKAFNSQLTLISLIAEDPFTGADFYYSASIMKEYFIEAEANAQKSLAQAIEIASNVGATAEAKIVRGAVSAEGIIASANDLGADLIVMGSHGRKGFQKFFLGSFAQDVLGSSELPVLVIKA